MLVNDESPLLRSDVKKIILHTLSRIKNDKETQNYDNIPQELQTIAEYTKLEIHQYPLCVDSEVDLLTFLSMIFQEFQDNASVIFQGTTCIWYLSRNANSSYLICSSSYGLLPSLMRFLTWTALNIFINATNAISNCCLHPQNHEELLKVEYGFLDIICNDLSNLPRISRHYRTIGCLTSLMSSTHLNNNILQYPFIERMISRLILVSGL
jgi:hypothetical protein